MAVADLLFQIIQGSREVHKLSSTLAPKFGQVGVGTVVLSDDGSGNLSLGGAQLTASALAAGLINVGNASGVATPTALSGDITIDQNGVVTISNLAVSGAKLAGGSVTKDKLANNVAGLGLSRNGVSLALDINADGTTLAIVNGVLMVAVSGIDTAQLNNGGVTAIKLSPGLQTELASHETRITNLESQIAQLTAALAAIQANVPMQQVFTSTAGQTDFTLTGFTVDPSNSVYDVEVRVDGRVQTLATSVSKASATVIRLSEAVPAGKEVVVFKRGTSSGPAVTQSVANADLTNVTVPVAPQTNGAKSLGLPAQAWSSLFIKDTATSQVYQLIITNGGVAFNPV